MLGGAATTADEAARRTLDRHAVAQMRQAIPAMALGAGAVWLLLHDRVPRHVLGWWLAAAAADVVRVIVRLWLDARRDRARPAWVDSTAWDIANHASFGLLWGGLVVAAGRWGEPDALWPALVVVMAVMAMAVVASAGARHRFAVIATCALGPTVVVLLASPGWAPVGLLLGCFAGIVTVVHRTLDRALSDAVRTGEHNRALAAELSEFISDRDPVTALLNRRGFQAAVAGLAATAAGGSEVAVAVANVERLAAVNELFDEATGDAVLRVLAERVGAVAGRHRLVPARLGGDEFALAGLDGGTDLGLLLRELVEEPIVVDGRSLHIDLHVAAATGRPADATALTADATAEVQRIRAQRRPNLHRSPDPIAVRRALLDELPAALRSGAVCPWFQPIVAADTGEVRGWEALVRWVHPRLGVLAPNRFLPLAVVTGLADELTDVVLDGALRFLAVHLAADPRAPVKVHVNVSPGDLRRTGFADTVLALLRAHRVPADALVLEITEHDILAVDQPVLDNVSRLDHAGIDLAVDDFGTGFSSLTHLQVLPIRQLKIDRSFVAALDDRRSVRLVESIVGLAHGMRFGVVAEGVETERQAEMLRAAGCPELQGYLFGRPAPAEALSSARGADRAAARR